MNLPFEFGKSMNKNAFAVAALAVLALTGCAQDAAGQSATAPSAKPAVITPAQEASLRDELRAVVQSLDTPRAMPNVMVVCKMIQRGTPEQAQREQVERVFFRSADPNAAVPAGAPDRIIEVIKVNGFCQV